MTNNGFKRDAVERWSAATIMVSLLIFVLVAAYSLVIAVWRETEPPELVENIVLIMIGAIMKEAAGVVVGRGENASFEGHSLANGHRESTKEG